MLCIGIAAPVVSVLIPSTAVAAGAIAGLWIFLGRTTLTKLQCDQTDLAAAVQEKFDMRIFDMPVSVERSKVPSREDIMRLTGSETEVVQAAEKEKLVEETGWYPINLDETGPRSVAICQRANASYADSLLRSTATAWRVVIVVWALVLTAACIILRLSFETVLLGIMLPLLPAILDVIQYATGIRRAAVDRAELARSIERRLEGDEIDNNDLLVWQGRLYELRRSTPEVPNLIYRIMRRRNEQAMHSAADQLSSQGGNA
tara:strand:- start:1744 stop:2523 length:780 start_codon:yes stop_codon:yes gene_type:complete